ncbi:MAG: hypothetical protein ACE5NM_11970 [Sedimentisphaerales bacterium]
MGFKPILQLVIVGGLIKDVNHAYARDIMVGIMEKARKKWRLVNGYW